MTRGPAMREAATKELRDQVQAQVALGRKVLVVPHLMSFGGIEQGIRKRLDGLDYTMTDAGADARSAHRAMDPRIGGDGAPAATTARLFDSVTVSATLNPSPSRTRRARCR